MKLVLWLGGPRVVESDEFPGEFVPAHNTSDEEWDTLLSMKGLKNVRDFLPLEVD